MASQKTDSVPVHESNTPNIANVPSVPICSGYEDHLVDVPIYTAASATISSFPYRPSDAFSQSLPFIPSPSSCFPFYVMPIPHIVDNLFTSAISAIDPCIYSLLIFFHMLFPYLFQ